MFSAHCPRLTLCSPAHVRSCQRRRGRMRSSSTRSSNPCSGITCGSNKEPVISGSQCLCKIDPCKYITCRPHFEPVQVGSKCVCRYVESAGSECECRYAQSAGVYLDVFGYGTRADAEDETAVAPGGGSISGTIDVPALTFPCRKKNRRRRRRVREQDPVDVVDPSVDTEICLREWSICSGHVIVQQSADRLTGRCAE